MPSSRLNCRQCCQNIGKLLSLLVKPKLVVKTMHGCRHVLIDSDTPSKTTDDLHSGISEATVKQARALVDPIITSSK